MSQPKLSTPSARASTIVVPEPQKGSITILGWYFRRKISTRWGMNLPRGHPEMDLKEMMAQAMRRKAR